ncbi:MAG: MBL fold metallo-hydrolase [Legionellales bacterium]
MNTYQLFESGYCYHCERMTLKTGSLTQRQYPALCVLINHPDKGYLLFDTGYTNRFFQLTHRLPYSLYRYLTPVTIKRSLKDQLVEKGIRPEDINYIVISHFHADHIGGLADYPNAQFICHEDALEDVKGKKGFKALLQGFLPGLLPNDFYERLRVLGGNPIELDPALQPFTVGFDIFDDKQLIAIALPGHAKGHIGLYVKGTQDAFFIGDSCWHQEAFQDLNLPSQLTYLVHDNKEHYLESIQKLHQLYLKNKELLIIPSHCAHARELVGAPR